MKSLQADVMNGWERHKSRTAFLKERRRHPERYPLFGKCVLCRKRDPIVRLVYHHEDYRFPLAVVPLCQPHHAHRHTDWGDDKRKAVMRKRIEAWLRGGAR